MLVLFDEQRITGAAVPGRHDKDCDVLAGALVRLLLEAHHLLSPRHARSGERLRRTLDRSTSLLGHPAATLFFQSASRVAYAAS